MRLGIVDLTPVYPETRRSQTSEDLEQEAQALLEAAGIAVVAEEDA